MADVNDQTAPDDQLVALDLDDRARSRRRLLGCMGAGGLGLLGFVIAVGIIATVLLSQLEGCDLDFSTDPGQGTESKRLAVQVTPTTGLGNRTLVSVTSSAFDPKIAVGVAVCLREADTERRGVDACDEIQGARYATDADGRLAATYVVPRLVRVGDEVVDCASAAGRCLLVAADASDYDSSGGRALTFADDLPPMDPPPTMRAQSDELGIGALPKGPQAPGTRLRVQAQGFQPGEPLLVAWCTDAFATEGPTACEPLDSTTALEAVAFRSMPDEPVANPQGVADVFVEVPATIRPYGAVFGSSDGTTTTSPRPDGRHDCRTRPGACAVVIAAAADTKRSAVLPYTVASS